MNNFSNPMDWFWPAGVYPTIPTPATELYENSIWRGVQPLMDCGGLLEPLGGGLIKKEEVALQNPTDFGTGRAKEGMETSNLNALEEFARKTKLENARMGHFTEKSMLQKSLKIENNGVDQQLLEGKGEINKKSEKKEPEERRILPFHIKHEMMPYRAENQVERRFKRGRPDREGPNELSL